MGIKYIKSSNKHKIYLISFAIFNELKTLKKPELPEGNRQNG
jgi:hypothetical protein